MAAIAKSRTGTQTLQELGKLFAIPANDRHVYCVFGPYGRLRPFQQRLRQEVERGSFNAQGRVEYVSLTRDLFGHMKTRGTYDLVARLADQGHNEQLRNLLSQAYRDIVTARLEPETASGLVLSDLELLYAYDLGNNDLSFARQVAINGKRVCLLVPGAMRGGRLWIFDEEPESCREFPEALVFADAGWVFELMD